MDKRRERERAQDKARELERVGKRAKEGARGTNRLCTKVMCST